MKISELPTKRQGRAGNWRKFMYSNGRHEIRHYGTTMIEWTENSEGIGDVYLNMGWGSMSDQQGMNQIFRTLELPYYYTRSGGSWIIDLRTDADDKRIPKYKRDRPDYWWPYDLWKHPLGPLNVGRRFDQ